MILIAGGTGTLGRELVQQLTDAGTPVRVLTRDPARAVAGCSVVVSAVHGLLGGRGAGPETVDDRGNAHLMRAAADASVDRVVLISALGAGPNHPLSLHRAKYRAEQHLHASGLSWTVLRPSAYLETWAGIVGTRMASGGPALVFGRGTNPINFVSARDVAALVSLSACDPALAGQTIDVPGPANLTLLQLARMLGATRIRHIPRPVLRLLALTAPPSSPPWPDRPPRPS